MDCLVCGLCVCVIGDVQAIKQAIVDLYARHINGVIEDKSKSSGENDTKPQVRRVTGWDRAVPSFVFFTCAYVVHHAVQE